MMPHNEHTNFQWIHPKHVHRETKDGKRILPESSRRRLGGKLDSSVVLCCLLALGHDHMWSMMVSMGATLGHVLFVSVYVFVRFDELLCPASDTDH